MIPTWLLDSASDVNQPQPRLGLSFMCELLGVRIDVRSDSFATIDKVAAYLAPYFETTQNAKHPDLVINVHSQPAPPYILDCLSSSHESKISIPWFFGSHIDAHEFSGKRIVRCHEAIIVLGSSGIDCWINTSVMSDWLLLIRLIRESALSRIKVNYLKIHGGIVAFRRFSCLVVGAGGAGKTSFIVNSLTHGAGRFCANDRAIVTCEQNILWGHGTPIQSQIGERLLDAVKLESIGMAPGGQIGFWSKIHPFRKMSMSPALLASIFDTLIIPKTKIDAVVIPDLTDTAKSTVIKQVAQEKRLAHLESQLLNLDPAFPSSIFQCKEPRIDVGLLVRVVDVPWYSVEGHFQDKHLSASFQEFHESNIKR